MTDSVKGDNAGKLQGPFWFQCPSDMPTSEGEGIWPMLKLPEDV